MADSLINTLVITLFGISLIVFYFVGIVFWYAFFPILIILSLIKVFNKTQEKYKYDLKFWIESLNIMDAILIITYILSLSLYFVFTELRIVCLYINIGSFILYFFNYDSKSHYYAVRSNFTLPYIDFKQNKKFILNKFNDIVENYLISEDIDLLRDLRYKNIKVVYKDALLNYKEEENNNYNIKYENQDLIYSISRLIYCQFVIKKEINDNSYMLSINKNLLPYINEL